MAMRPKVPVTMRSPFGGIQNERDERNIAPTDTPDCFNVHTANGDIEKRKGVLRADSHPGHEVYHMRAVSLNSTPYVLTIGTSRQLRLFQEETLATATPSVNTTIGPEGDPYPHIAQAGAVVFVACGGMINSRKLYWASSEPQAWRIGIEQPAAISLTDLTGGGTLPDGTYSYRITYYNSDSGTESQPSDEDTVAVATANTNAIRISAVPLSSDNQATHYRIYRKRSGVDSTWFFLIQRAIGSGTYDDTGAVTLSSSFGDQLNLQPGIPPTSSMCVYHKRRMFWRDDDNASRNTLAYSELDKPERVGTLSRLYFGSGGNDPIMTAVSALGYLFVFCRNSIWAVAGDGPSSFIVEKIVDGIGCVAPYSVCFDAERNLILFASKAGVCAFDGTRARIISGPVQSLYEQFSQDQRMQAGIEPSDRLYIISGRFDGAYYTQQLVLDMNRGNWFRWRMPSMSFSDHRTKLHRLYMGVPVAGGIATYGGTDGQREFDTNDTPIECYWYTGAADLGITRRKRFHYVSVAWKTNATDEVIGVETLPEDGSVSVLSSYKGGWLNPSRATWRIGRRLTKARFKITVPAAFSRWRISCIEIDGQAVNKR